MSEPDGPQGCEPPSLAALLFGILTIVPLLLARFAWVGLILLGPLLPFFVLIWATTHLVHLHQPLQGWVMLACSVGMLVVVLLPATAHPPRPGQRASLRWRLGGWWARYLPPPWAFLRRRPRHDKRSR